MKNHIRLLALLALALAPLAGHAQIIYQHVFDATGEVGALTLNGSALDTGGATWVSSSRFTQNGEVITTSGANSVALAYVNAAIEWSTNTTYKLTLDYNLNVTWVSLGFLTNTSVTNTAHSGAASNSAGWMIVRKGTGDKLINVWGGSGTSDQWLANGANIGVGAVGAGMQMIITITTGATLAESSIAYSAIGSDGVLVTALTKTGVDVSTWKYISISQNTDTASNAKNQLNSLTFEIVPIPEPSTFAALAGLATLGVVLFRRRRA